ncbi:exodeoxyribonuclease VII small subunit [Hoyosella altamirensis]|uniref:Exodeoxyribonuclease 7 small subunit n=1 Tax=Hoyosella altamirensis TaxID=616997 RepID=A0A839RIP2_9ACTN|nr:exodeoxyribonuclease VII small subunit [Hoyosella altamirensis]MBB3036044.1 exodeoxyribonuclease VII small subunit [Hoyosella altamirensis]
MTETESAGPAGVDGRADVSALGYEQARDELVEVVRNLERGGLDLDTSIALWERGEALADRCEQHLAGARQRIETAIARHGRDENSDSNDSAD